MLSACIVLQALCRCNHGLLMIRNHHLTSDNQDQDYAFVTAYRLAERTGAVSAKGTDVGSGVTERQEVRDMAPRPPICCGG